MPRQYPYSVAYQKCSSKIFYLFLLLLLLQHNSWAQETAPAPQSLLQRYEPTSSDTVSTLRNLSPQHVTSTKNSFSKTAVLITAGAGLWLTTYSLADEPLQRFTQSNRNKVTDALARTVEPLGRPGTLVPIAGAAAIGGILLKDTKLQKAGFVTLGSVMASAVVTNTLKKSFNRFRPSVTTENHIFDGRVSGSTSLPSSHTSTAFAAATSIATVYRDNRWVPPLAYGVATLVGLSRINDNAHWATDVIAGAAVGYFTAKGVTRLYDAVNQRLQIRKQRLLLAPQLGLRSGSLSATLVF